jgi:hypothetical protein
MAKPSRWPKRSIDMTDCSVPLHSLIKTPLPCKISLKSLGWLIIEMHEGGVAVRDQITVLQCAADALREAFTWDHPERVRTR